MIDLDKNILYKTEPNVDETTLSEYITKLLTLQARAIHLAQKKLKSLLYKSMMRLIKYLKVMIMSYL